ncbi:MULTISPECIES: amino acid ABC transporter ATP-binding protein [unclassified Variovorax]|uniref:amino acid ABC transporter ATP-binding protein n=1 Tax=unclassified Variovorax TaxID=663243 RepID=UPI002574FF10|nr:MULTISPECIES: amino acid ABC transporter ATP-binding protein [unclassified Variovorax]MDM0086634.1 amino acid ABC transporter ATP-binding protein [Variovorax sp. J22G40]MDM0145110.1 amino acid ABC transporter ATP-binding protein [Variovorax sp. J2P1-31]
MSLIEIKGLKKSFGALDILRGVDLNLDAGMTAIIGRSGSGKSTLLRCLNGLERIDAGSIRIDRHQITPTQSDLKSLRADVGIVFQGYNLFPHMTVEKNITLAPMLVQGTPRAQAQDKALHVLSQVGLLEKAKAYPGQLSGGQQQRVAIARALALNPKVILFDEVTSALDPELTGEVLKVMESLSSEGMTQILVTHEMNFARRAARTLVFMHQGKVWEHGPTAELFARPQTKELDSFLSSIV